MSLGNIVCGGCSGGQITQVRRCYFQKKNGNNSAGQGLMNHPETIGDETILV